jgi:hypothetical protein
MSWMQPSKETKRNFFSSILQSLFAIGRIHQNFFKATAKKRRASEKNRRKNKKSAKNLQKIKKIQQNLKKAERISIQNIKRFLSLDAK